MYVRLALFIKSFKKNAEPFVCESYERSGEQRTIPNLIYQKTLTILKLKAQIYKTQQIVSQSFDL